MKPQAKIIDVLSEIQSTDTSPKQVIKDARRVSIGMIASGLRNRTAVMTVLVSMDDVNYETYALLTKNVADTNAESETHVSSVNSVQDTSGNGSITVGMGGLPLGLNYPFMKVKATITNVNDSASSSPSASASPSRSVSSSASASVSPSRSVSSSPSQSVSASPSAPSNSPSSSLSPSSSVSNSPSASLSPSSSASSSASFSPSASPSPSSQSGSITCKVMIEY